MNSEIEIQLREELRVRNIKLLIPHLILMTFSLYVFKKIQITIPYLVLLTGISGRYFISKYKPELFKLFKMFVAFTGIGWGLVFLSCAEGAGFYSIESLYSIGIVIITMSGGVTAFSASYKTTVIFLFSLTIIPFVYLITQYDQFVFLGFLLAVNFVYQCYHAHIANSYIRKSVSKNQSLQEFMNAIPGFVTVIDKNETFVMVNNNLKNIFPQMLGMNLKNFLPGSDMTRVVSDFFYSDAPSGIFEVRGSVTGPDNWYMVHLCRISTPYEGIIVSVMPITELVKVKNDLRIQEARSQYAAKLASLGEMSAGIAHEVNNPLTIIEGAANLMKIILQDPVIDVHTLDKSATKIIDTSQRIAKIVKSLRTLSGDAEDEPFCNVSFKAIIEPCLEISKSKLDTHGIKLEIHQPETQVDLFGNEIQLCQVIMNLVANAIDAVKEHSGPKWIRITYRPSEEWLDIDVIDSGSGVSEDIEQKIMDPFFTTKEAHQGTGLGLSISRSIVENHQGTLQLLKDAVNTTFRIRFPRMNSWPDSKRNSSLAGIYAVQK